MNFLCSWCFAAKWVVVRSQLRWFYPLLDQHFKFEVATSSEHYFNFLVSAVFNYLEFIFQQIFDTNLYSLSSILYYFSPSQLAEPYFSSNLQLALPMSVHPLHFYIFNHQDSQPSFFHDMCFVSFDQSHPWLGQTIESSMFFHLNFLSFHSHWFARLQFHFNVTHLLP